jgi:hypothetical protein
MEPISILLEEIGLTQSNNVKFIKNNFYYSEKDKTYYVIYRSREPGFFTDEAQSLLFFFGTGLGANRKIIFLFFCSGVTADFQIFFGTIEENHEDFIKMKSKEIISKYYKKTPYKYSISNDDGPRKIPK